MKKPKTFALSKVKLTTGGGISITYRETKEDKGSTDTIDWSTTSSVNPHPELVDKVNELKEYLAKCYGMDSMVVLSKSKGLSAANKKAFKEVSEVVENVFLDQMKKISITGVSISGLIDGEKDKRSVVITATQLMDNKSKTALNSPRIKLNNNQFKFEADVQDIINDLEEEVSAYLFEGKKAQLDMFQPPKEDKLSKEFIEGKGKNLKKVEDREAA